MERPLAGLGMGLGSLPLLPRRPGRGPYARRVHTHGLRYTVDSLPVAVNSKGGFQLLLAHALP